MASSFKHDGLGSIINQYLENILDSVPEHKILILDKYTTGVVSQVKGQTEMLDKGVYLFNQLGRRPETDSDVRHLDAVVLVRPTKENVDKLCAELQNPKHKNYHIFFTNVLPEGKLSMIAEADEFELVVQVKLVFMDFVPVNSDLWNLRIPNSFSLMNESMGNKIYDYHVQSLVSVLLATKTRPQIRYDKSSNVCKRLALQVQRNIEDYNDLFSWDAHGADPLLIILDRRQDPVTPLLLQWHYQAMTHELLGIKNSRVDLKNSKNTDIGEAVLNTFCDDFFERHQFSNFGDLGVAVKGLVEDYSKRRGDNSNIESIEDMQRFVEGYGEYMQSANAVSKHVGVLTELSTMVAQRKLLEISALEQSIAISENMNKHFEEICAFIQDGNVADEDCLRLVILYALRYEGSNCSNLIRMREQLRSRSGGRNAVKVRLVDLVLNTCGQNFRTGDLFNNQSLTGRFTNALKGLKGVDNIYTQHRPYLENILNDILKLNLRQVDYPIVDGRLNKRSAPTEIIVFVVGGVTYEEAQMVRELSQKTRTPMRIGGSCIHNSRSFLKDLNDSTNFGVGHTSVLVDDDGEPELF